MKVLVLGDPNSLWEKEFIQYVLLPMGVEVILQDNYNNGSLYHAFYAESGVAITPLKPIPNWIMKIAKFRGFMMNRQYKKALQPYAPFDVIINMFVSPTALRRAVSWRYAGARVYAYFCGSEIIRASMATCYRLKPCLKRVAGVVFASDSVHDAYMQKIGKLAGVRMATVRLGLSVLKCIDSMLQETRGEDHKSRLDLTADKTTICIGYNASAAQNHMLILTQIQRLPRELLDRLTLLLPMTYGGSDAYIAQVEKVVEGLGCDYKLFRHFMDHHEMAQLWLATDIFINAQSTDGLSGSVLEALYAGAVLLNASWLRYREYEAWGLEYVGYSHYEEIPDLLTHLGDCSQCEKSKNRSILQSQMSWEQCRTMWSNLLASKEPS
ncbi:MAG: hypothetical protein RR224_12165 [Clostridia bacterium]